MGLCFVKVYGIIGPGIMVLDKSSSIVLLPWTICRLLSNEESFVNISRKIKTAEQHSILVLLLLLNTPNLDEIKMSHVTSEFLLHNFHTVH
jgi:hypothetical protein